MNTSLFTVFMLRQTSIYTWDNGIFTIQILFLFFYVRCLMEFDGLPTVKI